MSLLSSKNVIFKIFLIYEMIIFLRRMLTYLSSPQIIYKSVKLSLRLKKTLDTGELKIIIMGVPHD